MKSLYEYYGYAKLAYMAEQLTKGKSYTVYDVDGKAVFGLVNHDDTDRPINLHINPQALLS
jgi:hypothetical protein